MQIQIQGFDDKKLEVFTALKNRSTGSIKNCYLFIPRPPGRTSKVQKKPPALRREHPALQNYKFLHFYLFLWFIFALQDPNPSNQNQYGSSSASTTMKTTKIA
jgi:hypothetical protein